MAVRAGRVSKVPRARVYLGQGYGRGQGGGVGGGRGGGKSGVELPHCHKPARVFSPAIVCPSSVKATRLVLDEGC